MSKERIEIVIIVNGEPVTEKAHPDEEVGEVVSRALNDSGNSGQPLNNWELRDESGHVIDFGRKFRNLDIKPGATLFLNLKAGVGGDDG